MGKYPGDELGAPHGGCGERQELLPRGRGELSGGSGVVEKGLGGVEVREAGEDGWGEFVEALGGAIDFAPQRQQER